MADAARYVGSLKDSAAYGTLITDKDGNIALLQIGNKVVVDRERGFTDIARELTQREFEYKLNKEAMRKFIFCGREDPFRKEGDERKAGAKAP